ncbi:Uncharacterised protein [Clostridioides difficile]|nr:Uncharacterised protein [Clostridioides difficile]
MIMYYPYVYDNKVTLLEHYSDECLIDYCLRYLKYDKDGEPISFNSKEDGVRCLAENIQNMYFNMKWRL